VKERSYRVYLWESAGEDLQTTELISAGEELQKISRGRRRKENKDKT
jgi:hypothetical protein